MDTTQRVLDFNSVNKPTLKLTMMDAARTVIRVKTPTEGMIHELQQLVPELKNLETGDRSAVEAIYDLGARLISCNRDFIKVTAEDLRSEYGMELEDMVLFFSAYSGFISEVMDSKN